MTRLLEPSTWAGFAAIIFGLKGFLPPQYAALADGVAAVAGSIAVALRERAGGAK